MTVELSDIAGCFQGSIPSIIATSSSDGEPNVAHLSQVFLVDDQHVATSNQFFAKTMANLAENPLATLMCPDPADLTSYKLLVRHVGTQREGALFDAARVVDRCHRGAHWNGRCLCPEIDGRVSGTEHRSSGSAITDPGDVSQQDPTTIALSHLGDRLASTTGLEAVIDTSLDSIDELLGHGSSLLLVYQRRARSPGDIGKPRVRLGRRRVRGRPGGGRDRDGCGTTTVDAHRQSPANVVLRQNGATHGHQ